MAASHLSVTALPEIVRAEPVADARRAELAALANRKCPPLLFVVEGMHDIRFLRRISRTLHAMDSALPDLAAWEAAGRLVFLPFGGGDVWDWTDRLEPLGLRELHLYDAEAGVEAAYRQRAAAAVNARPHCRAFVTSKRNLENYLSPVAIQEARGVFVHFSDTDNVADLVAREVYEQSPEGPIWELLPGRARKRYRERVKHWLNTAAAERMSAERLRESDRQGDITRWLRTVVSLAEIP
jgi:putative ATP-dependent endonuclease of OLD family